MSSENSLHRRGKHIRLWPEDGKTLERRTLKEEVKVLVSDINGTLSSYNGIRIFYNEKDNEKKCQMLKYLNKDYSINKIVIPKKHSNLDLECLEELYKDNEYVVYKVEF